MLPSVKRELLEKAKVAFDNNDKPSFDSTIYQILTADNNCDEAWSLLYKRYGKSRTYDEFKAYFVQKYFSKQDVKPAQSVAATISPPTKPRQPAAIPPDINAINNLESNSILAKSNILYVETKPTCPYCNLPFKSNDEVQSHILRWHPQSDTRAIVKNQPAIVAPVTVSSQHQVTAKTDPTYPSRRHTARKSRGTFGSIAAGVIYMPYAGFYALPTIVCGEILLWLIAQGMKLGEGGDILGMILGPIVLIFMIGLLSFVVPFIGTLIYIFFVATLIISGVVGGIVGLGLGITCGIGYLLTRWASGWVATIACAILGGIAGYIAATWAVNMFISFGQGWVILNYVALMITGIVGGILFVAVADDTELGSRANERAISDSQSAKSYSPIRMYINLAEYFKWNADMGEQNK